METKIFASSKVGYILPFEEVINFSGKAAGVCYMPDSFDTLMQEPLEKTNLRAYGTLQSGHHSVFDHPVYTLLFENIPKFIAMMLNNEQDYVTSEKSARYTKMKLTDKELELYNKWLNIFNDLIETKYGEKFFYYHGMNNEKAHNAMNKLAQENARYMISVFTPTTMLYTVSARQLNYIVHFFKNYINDFSNDSISSEFEKSFKSKLKVSMQEFLSSIPSKIINDEFLNADLKGRKISIFDSRLTRKEDFSESYCTTYKGSLAQYAQAHRHRTISYKIRFLDDFECYVPEILKDNDELHRQWASDMTSVSDIFPQGMLVSIRERGTYEVFIQKCYERLCGCAQLEIALQTKRTLEKYLKNVKQNGEMEIYNELLNYSKGARCGFPDFVCSKPCIWGFKDALNRKI